MRRAILFFLLAIVSVNLFAGPAAEKVKWSAKSEKLNDSTFNIIITANIASGWHMFSFNPGGSGDGSLLPPEFTFSKNSNVKLLGKIKENGKIIDEDTKDKEIGIVHYFKNNVTYTQKAIVKANTKLKCTIRFMTCDESMCLPPEDLTIEIPFTGLKRTADNDTATGIGTAVEHNDTAQTTSSVVGNDTNAGNTTGNSDTASVRNTASSSSEGSHSSLWVIFITGFLAGFGAFITPCIFSMLPITVSFFTKRSKSKAEGLKNATIYSLSIVTIFALFGLLISLFFSKTTMYTISTSTIFNLFVFILFLIFGISLLGAFEITLPSSWSSKLDAKANTNSASGIFLMALVLVIVSFSCTSAFMSTLITRIFDSGDRMGGVVGFFAFGLALAIPFALFAYFPGLLNSLAKSGGWLNSVKVTMGFIELALAMKYLSNVDLKYHWHLLNYDVYIAIWIALSGLLGLYLIGKIRFSHDDGLPKNMFGQPYISVTRFFFALTSFAFMIYLLPGMFGAPLTPISGFLSERKTLEFNLEDLIANGPSGGGATIDNNIAPKKYTDIMKSELPGVPAYFDYNEALAAAKATGRPILLDFTGHSCLNCRKMERAVLSKPEVSKMLREDFILASLYCDDGTELTPAEKYTAKDGTKVKTLGDRNIDIEGNRYGEVGQPIYIFVDSNGNILKKAGGYVDDVPRFVNILKEVKEAYKNKTK